MIIIGITGSIGMGKTTVSGMFAKMGCAVHNSDAVVRQALLPKGRAFEKVALMFPKSWDKKTHMIKRDVLANIIFNDAKAKKKLEDILHPIVQADQKKFIQAQKRLGKKTVVLDIPLLFETGAEARVDCTVVVSAPYAIQRRRVLSRAGMSAEKFKAIVNTQMSDDEKRKRADFIVQTGLGLAHAHRQVQNILSDIKGV